MKKNYVGFCILKDFKSVQEHFIKHKPLKSDP